MTRADLWYKMQVFAVVASIVKDGIAFTSWAVAYRCSGSGMVCISTLLDLGVQKGPQCAMC